MEAAKAPDDRAALGAIGRVFSIAEALGPEVLRAILSGAELRSEILQSIDRCARPVHAMLEIKYRAELRIASTA